MSQETLTALTWLVPVPPLLTFFLIILFTKHNRRLSWMMAWAAIFISLASGWTVAFNMFGRGVAQVASHHGDTHGEAAEHGDSHAEETDTGHGEEAAHGDEMHMEGEELSLAAAPTAIYAAFDWLPIGECGVDLATYLQTTHNCPNWLDMGVAVDPLTAVMLFMVPFAVAMIFVYSVGYHNFGQPLGKVLGVPNHGKEEPLLSRFFAFMCLFAGGMLTLVVADNLLLLFVGWEIMGLCSYLLIGFWYARTYEDPEKIQPRHAAIKAFMTTRIGDVFMLLGIASFLYIFGTLNFREALSAHSLAAAVEFAGTGNLAIMALLLFIGTVGKSAQFPLHVWLPDAMEGPTPVSAVIHAAAMVSAGVYMVLRIFPLINVAMAGAPWLGLVIGLIGAITALLAATIAVAQYDVKGVLAFSTISQLGFMIAAIGIGAYVAAAFHLITHAFFKALLFLGSGSIIHGMEHGAEHVHDHHTDPQDMRNMGGLKDKMPKTFWTFVIGGFALSGFPFITAGFWSKDEILADAWYLWSHDGNGLALLIFITLALAAFLTAFYTMRQIVLTFFGKPRTPLAEHAHESNNYMVLPLIALAFFAITAGWVGIPDDYPVGFGSLFGGENNFFHHFVGLTVEETFVEFNALSPHDAVSGELIHANELHTLPFNIVPVAVSIIVAVGGLILGWMQYGVKPLKAGEEDPLVRPLGPLHPFLHQRWMFDKLYDKAIVQPVNHFSEVIVYEYIDKGMIDGTLHFVARSVYSLGQFMKRTEELVMGDFVDWCKDQFLSLARDFRTFQTGKIQDYVMLSLFVAGLFALVIIMVQAGLLSGFAGLGN